jgi:hypothetical protein
MVPLYPEGSVETTPLRVTFPPVHCDNLATSLDISIVRGSDKSEIAEIDEQIATNRRVVFFNNPALQVAASPSIRIFGGDSAEQSNSLVNLTASKENILFDDPKQKAGGATTRHKNP